MREVFLVVLCARNHEISCIIHKKKLSPGFSQYVRGKYGEKAGLDSYHEARGEG